MARCYLLIGALALSVGASACTARGIRARQGDSRLPAAALSFRDAVGDRATAAPAYEVEQAAGATVEAPRATSPRGLKPEDLGFLEPPIDEAVWTEASAESYETPSPISETLALTVFFARSQALRAARSRLDARRNRLGQALYLERLVEQYEGFARRPDDREAAWPLPGPEALRGAAVDRDVALSAEEFRAAVLDQMTQFTMAFHEARYLRRAVATYGENLTLSRRFADVVRTRYASGQARKADLLKADMRLEETREMLRTARNALAAAEARLGSVLDVAEPVAAGEAAPRRDLPPLAVARQASASAPDLQIAELEWERARATLELVERRILPDLSTGLSERLGDTASVGFPAHYVTGSPFAEELRDRVAARARALAQARTAIPAEAERVWAALSEAARVARLHRQVLVPKANDALASIESEYRVGRATYLELDDLQRQWLRVSLEAARAERDAHVAASRLRRTLGRWPGPAAATHDAEEVP
jgi:hypothetical protein